MFEQSHIIEIFLYYLLPKKLLSSEDTQVLRSESEVTFVEEDVVNCHMSFFNSLIVVW